LHGAGLGAEDVCVLPVHAVPAFTGDTALAAQVRGGQVGCQCRVLAQNRRPANVPWARDDSTGTGKTWVRCCAGCS
jgi:hypothetical protein